MTVQPDLNDTTGRVGAEMFDIAHGRGLGWALSGIVNLPVVQDVMAVSASYSRRRTPGFIDNILTGDKDTNDAVQEGGRLAMLWRPASEFTVRLSAMRQSVNSDDAGVIFEGPGNSSLAPGAPFLSTNAQLLQPFKSKFHFYFAGLAYDFGFAEISSTTSHSKIDIKEVSDATRVFGGIFGGLAPFPRISSRKSSLRRSV